MKIFILIAASICGFASCSDSPQKPKASIDVQITELVRTKNMHHQSEGDLYISSPLPILRRDDVQKITVRPIFDELWKEDVIEFGLDKTMRMYNVITLEFSKEDGVLKPSFAGEWRDGDHVRLWRTSKASWDALGGRAGYAHIRGDVVLSINLVAMN